MAAKPNVPNLQPTAPPPATWTIIENPPAATLAQALANAQAQVEAASKLQA